ncbi:MAG: DUF433 domain-containing protein [Candidatus Rokuibacteriota bacterium]
MARKTSRSSAPRSVRFRPWIREQVERIARRSRRPFSEVVQDLLDETLRTRQCPGIYFADEPAGREAKIAGTGLAVWEVIRDYLAEGRDERKLRDALPVLTPAQVKAALLYYNAWRTEIDQLIADNANAASGLA